MIDYLEARAAEPCGRSCLSAALSGLAFVERAAQVPVETRLGTSEILQGAAAELTRGLDVTQPGDRRQAHQLLTCLLVAWERVVVDEAAAPYVRFWAWARLLKCWGSLRSDDLKWIDHESVKISEKPF